MDVRIQEALQNGKAHHNMKKIWMIRWAAGMVFLFIFLFLIIGIVFLDLIIDAGIIGIIFYYFIIPLIIGLLFSYGWASLYWNNYRFEVGAERVKITRGVIGKRVTNIPYERIQNVNIYRGVLDRIFGLYSIEIETAGGFNIMSTGGYGTRMSSEGSIQGLRKPELIADFILAKAKGKETLEDTPLNKTLNNAEKLKRLEERLLKGEISEKTYEEIKKKYEN